MELPKRASQIWHDTSGERLRIYRASDGTELSVVPGNISGSGRDFAIELDRPREDRYQNQVRRRPGGRYRPNHAFLFRDLRAKIDADEQGASELYDGLEDVFEGESPESCAPSLTSSNSAGEYPADLVVHLAQLFMIEQEFNYGAQSYKSTKFTVPRDFHMTYIRWVFSGDDDIDHIVDRATNDEVPPRRYDYDGDADLWTMPADTDDLPPV